MKSLSIRDNRGGLSANWFVALVTSRDIKIHRCLLFVPCVCWRQPPFNRALLWRSIKCVDTFKIITINSGPMKCIITTAEPWGTGLWGGTLLSGRPSRGFREMSPVPRLLSSQTCKQPIREEHSLNSHLLFMKLIYITKGSDRSSLLQLTNKPFRDLSFVFSHEPSWTRPFHHHQFAINVSLNNYKAYKTHTVILLNIMILLYLAYVLSKVIILDHCSSLNHNISILLHYICFNNISNP